MAYRIPAGMNFPGGMPGEPAAPPTPHTVSTGVRKAVVPQVKGRVTYGVRRPRTGRPANPKPTQPRPTRPKPGKPAPGPSDDALIQAATRLRFGPQEQGFTQQLGANTNYSAGIPGWYANALSEIKALQTQGQQTSQQNLAQIQSYNSQPALNTPIDQQAADARNNLNSQYGAMVGRDANANSAFMDRLAAANAVAQGNALAGAGRDRQQIIAGQTALKGQEGDFGTTYGAQLQSGRAKALNDQAKLDLAAKIYGLKSETLHKVQEPLAKSLAKNRTAGQGVARSNVRIKRQGQAETQRQHNINAAYKKNDLALKAYKLAHPNATGKPKGASTKAQEYFDSAQAKVREVHGDKKFDPQKEADLLSTSKHAIPRDIALAGAQMVKNQRLGVRGIDDPKLARLIFKRYGIRVPVVHQSPQIGGVVKGLLGSIPGE